ncbi:TetR/AcrR family transcriptional regulator [Nocardia sp. NBC_00508]|uniref:TetR/AcrR family transcriptional regulator n=1 Tax=Nocardia sp. NBC_00508 TaxID=2975992 RepID=UPI002E810C4E|nr:TetR/AcrR family transcriptional regulator [Nocardia sp. NBC_00508]WUD66986.1 TetR/AcrR family transcriptional regulator [Nocardia sp. NBC_00508]
MASDAVQAPPARVTRRRAETRNRLLAAAYEAFAEEGFGRATVESVCERAGFTRGAFYSNFSSLDELFLAMWEQRSMAMLAQARAILDEIAADGTDDVRTAVERLERAVPIDDGWYRITAEFTAHALRTPALRRVMAAREEAIVAALMPTIVAALARGGRTVPDPEAFGQALIAVHDGTSVQVLLEPGSRVVRARRTELFHHVVLAYSTATEG